VRRIKASNLNRGLVGAWCPSVAGNGLLLPDLSGYGNHGTLTNIDASDWVGTDKGRALDFDGVDDFVNCGTVVATGSRFTASGWLNVGNDDGAFIAKSLLGAFVNRWWIIINRNEAVGIYEAGTISIAGTNTFGSGVASAAAVGVNDGKWHFITGVWNNTSMELFYDSVSVATNSNIRANQPSTFNLLIGKYNDSSGGVSGNVLNLQGQINDIRIYDRALSPSEIKQLYEGGPGYGLRQERKRSRFAITVKPKRGARSPRKVDKGNLKQGLVGAWCPSVAGNGLLLPDLSGYGNHGTLTNMDASDWVGTDKGRALDFDGGNDYVDLGSSIQNTFTLLTFRSLILFKNINKKQAIISSYTLSPQGGWGVELLQNNTVNFFGFQNTTAFIETQTTQKISVNSWTDIVCIFNNGTASIYLNGLLAATASGVPFIYKVSSVRIGAAVTNEIYLDGQIVDARIYNRALSPSEIKQLYEGGPGFGLRQERKRSRFQVQGFNAGRFRRQQLIGSGVY